METAINTAAKEKELALITGAAHGIGKAIAQRLAESGFHVVATDPDLGQLDLNQRRWAALGLSTRIAKLDCRDRPGVRALIDEARRIDVVVNNAGIGSPLVGFAQLTGAGIREIFSINLIGSFVVAQEAARRMVRGGRIINIASRGYLGGAGAAHYVASKAAMVGLTRSMAVELRWSGITVNAVAPGMINTRALDLFEPAMRAKLEALEPSGQPAAPSSVADVVDFLASPAARFVSGQVLMVDGGKSVGVPAL